LLALAQASGARAEATDAPRPSEARAPSRKAKTPKTPPVSAEAPRDHDASTDSGSRWALVEASKPAATRHAWLAWVAALLVFGGLVVALMVR
jgi:hypothetical protein